MKQGGTEMTDPYDETDYFGTPESRDRDARLVGHEPKGETMTDDPKCEPGCISYYGGEKKHHRDCPYYPESLTKLNADRIEALLAERDALKAEAEDAAKTIRKCAASGHEGGFGIDALRQAHDKVEALTPSTPAPVRPKVKPLVWYDYTGGSVVETDTSSFYRITSVGGDWVCEGTLNGVFTTLKAAKAAAQADHRDRILSQIETAPVTVQEAARVLSEYVSARKWSHYPIEMPITESGRGPAKIGEDAVEMTYEVWDAVTFRTISSHNSLPVAIDAWLRALAEQEKTDDQ